MPTPSGFTLSPAPQQVFIDKFTNLPMAGGKVYCYKDTDRTPAGFKSLFKQTGTPNNYSYVALPNPVPLTMQGTWGDESGNDIAVYYYPYDIDGNEELYFLRVTNLDETPQLTREGWPNSAGIESGLGQDSFYVDDGIVNAFILLPTSETVPTTHYYNGLRVTFFAKTGCTGDSTVNVDSIGNKHIIHPSGRNLTLGDIKEDYETILIYKGDAATGEFILQPLQVNANHNTNYYLATLDVPTQLYTLTSQYPDNKCTAYKEGMVIQFIGGTNSGQPAAVNVDILGDQPIFSRASPNQIVPFAINGSIVTEAIFREGIGFVITNPGINLLCQVFSASISLLGGDSSTFIGLTVYSDEGGMYGPGSGLFTPWIDGEYEISISGMFRVSGLGEAYGSLSSAVGFGFVDDIRVLAGFTAPYGMPYAKSYSAFLAAGVPLSFIFNNASPNPIAFSIVFAIKLKT